MHRLVASVAVIALLGTAACSSGCPGKPKPVVGACADPNNLPFFNRGGQGCGNRIAELIAADRGDVARRYLVAAEARLRATRSQAASHAAGS
jgi:hypothetical protein